MAAPVDLATPMLAVAVITVTAQLFGALAQRCHQPRVVGEIVGGIVLGPSLLGALAPALETHLFTTGVRGQLNLLGQLGLVLFMFLVGLELNPNLLIGRLPLASRITAVGVPARRRRRRPHAGSLPAFRIARRASRRPARSLQRLHHMAQHM